MHYLLENVHPPYIFWCITVCNCINHFSIVPRLHNVMKPFVLLCHLEMPINKKTIPLKPYPSNAIFFFFFSSFSLFILDCSSFTCTKSHILFIINWLYCKLCEFMTCILVTSRITFYIHTLFICTC